MDRLVLITSAICFCIQSSFCLAGIGDGIPLASVRTVSLAARPIVRQGDLLPLDLNVSLDRSSPIECFELYSVRELRIDQKDVGVPPLAEQLATYQGCEGVVFISSDHGAFSSGWARPIDGAITSRLAKGRHVITAILRLERFNADRIDYDDSGHSFFIYSGIPTTSPATKPTATEDVSVTAAFVICDAAHEPPVVIVDPKLRAAMRAAVEIKPLTVSKDGLCSVDLMLQYPPKCCQFDVELRSSLTKQVLLTADDFICEANSQGGFGSSFTPPVKLPDKVDMILRPDIDAARRKVDNIPIWGEPLVFNNIPLIRASTQPSSLTK